ncbi:hypothetical protein PIB30_103966 [Stylosanthes scabra]|uniref:Uncharacterized protein n=1 Tax=Stylosanthes scabra TaxID=79078 RepID=A0ABU6QXK9_9FABA|nr:hypothetical protein [Stylosanthes scabra]
MMHTHHLPNPKGGINMVHNENDEEEDKEDDDEWLYGLLAELEDSDDDSDDEEIEEEPEREVDDEEVEEETKGETFFIATIFRENEVKETEMLVKCEDPGPCLVTSKIRGVDIPECLCDPGACRNVMPYALYETLDLGPLKKSKEVFTTVDASIVSVAEIADNVMMASKGKAPAAASPTEPRVDMKGKKVVQTPPIRASARLAAFKARTSQTPPPTSSTPAISQSTVKKPIFIDLTKDSESEGRSKEENPERKLANTLLKMIELRELDSDDTNLGFPYSTSSSSEEDDVLGNDPEFWDYDDLDDLGAAEPDASSEASCTSHLPPNH